MPFYEVLRLLITEPGKHHFRRRQWDNEYCHNDTKYIASFAVNPAYISVVIVHKSNNTGYCFTPSYADITVNDWFEVDV